MSTRPAVLAVVFVALCGLLPHALAASSAVALERLRLDPDGKVQVDIVVKSTSPPNQGRVDVQFTRDGDTETVTVVGLNGRNVRRIATATRPLACGESERVTVTVVAPEDAKGPTVHTTLRRRCQ